MDRMDEDRAELLTVDEQIEAERIRQAILRHQAVVEAHRAEFWAVVRGQA